MSDHSSHFESTGGGLVLTNAILLYQVGTSRTPTAYGAPRNDMAAFASMHAVEHDGDGRPTIAAGVPLSRAQLRAPRRMPPPQLALSAGGVPMGHAGPLKVQKWRSS